jgi:very-short-patch-repair endonuclease
MRPQGRTADQILATLATATFGVVTWQEAMAAGVTPSELRRRARRGALLREYPGVYRVGHRAPCIEASYLAAVRARGENAWLADLAAAHVFGLVGGPAPEPVVLTLTERRIPGIQTRRSRNLDRRRDTTQRRGIPITTVARTLVDIARLLGIDDLARACHEAGVRYRVTPAAVGAVLARKPNSPAAGKLRRVMAGEAPVTLSALERRFLELLRDHGLPRPVTNRPAGGRRVDCRWPAERLTVELDGYRFHSSRYAWERDRRREREAYARGDDFRRYTYGDVFERPATMLGELRALLI